MEYKYLVDELRDISKKDGKKYISELVESMFSSIKIASIKEAKKGENNFYYSIPYKSRTIIHSLEEKLKSEGLKVNYIPMDNCIKIDWS